MHNSPIPTSSSWAALPEVNRHLQRQDAVIGVWEEEEEEAQGVGGGSGGGGSEGVLTADCQRSTFSCPAFHTAPALLPLCVVNVPPAHSGVPIGRSSRCVRFYLCPHIRRASGGLLPAAVGFTMADCCAVNAAAVTIDGPMLRKLRRNEGTRFNSRLKAQHCRCIFSHLEPFQWMCR